MQKHYLKIFGVIAIALFFSFCSAESITEKGNKIRLEKLKVYSDGDSLTIEELIKRSGLTGLSVAVFDNYKIKDAHAWGEKEVGTGELVDNNTVFSTASIAKAITATLIVKLAHEEKIDLDVPVNTYLKRWKLAENDLTKNNPVTLRHLLLHTAGTTQGGFEDYYGDEEVPTVIQSLNGEVAPYNEPVEIVFAPGSKMQYSGGGYTVALVALEDYVGRSLQSLAKEHLFDPIGMKNSTFIQPNEPGFFTNAAKAHNERGEVYGLPICPQLSASGLWSNPEDMSLFLIEIQKGLLGKSKVFDQTMVEEMLQPAAFANGYLDRSLGWEVKGFGNLDWFAHGGANTGTGGHIFATRENGRGIAIFGNGPNGIRLPIIDVVRDAIIEAYDWSIDINEKYEIVENYKLDESLKGRYAQGLSLVQRDGQVAMTYGEKGDVSLELFYLGNNRFALDGYPFQYEFFTDADTKEVYIGIIGNGRTSLAKDDRKISDNPQSPYEFFESNSFETSLEYFKEQKKLGFEADVEDYWMNVQAYKYLGNGETQRAIDLLRIMLLLYPDSWNGFDSLGEMYLTTGDKQKAKENYAKSLELNPNNTNAKKVLKDLSSDN